MNGSTLIDGRTYIDCNDLPIWSVGYTYSNTLNTPQSYCNVLTFGYSNTIKTQLAVSTAGSTLYMGVRKFVNSSWSDWNAVALMNANSETSQIGEYKTGSAMIVNYITEEEIHTNLQSIKIQRGRWIIFGLITFSANANGYRSLGFSSTEPNLGIGGTKVRALAAGNNVTILSSSIFVNNTSYDEATIFLEGAKCTGTASTITVSSKLEAVRIA